jgi:hypothetical protein
MADISSKLAEIRKLVDSKQYFTINRPRQFGKTTAIQALENLLEEQYSVVSMSFEGIGKDAFSSEINLMRIICKILHKSLGSGSVGEEAHGELKLIYLNKLKHDSSFDYWELVERVCSTAKKPIVLIIDEVDKESDNEVFIGLLGGLRERYLKRAKQPTFHSVILAGVYDIKNLKLKIRPQSESRYNSPWNIAADFIVDMSLSQSEISSMLKEYEDDHGTGMDVGFICGELHHLTSGYPFLVSRMCKIIDEAVAAGQFPSPESAWTQAGLDYASKSLTNEKNTLFDDMVKKLSDFPELKAMLQDIIFSRIEYPFHTGEEHVDIGSTFGFIKNGNGKVAISNLIFERYLFKLFLAEDKFSNRLARTDFANSSQFIVNGMLQMDLVMERFLEGFTQVYAGVDEKFLEEQGRRIFMTFLLPIINGKGNMYIEPQTQTRDRMDLVVDYLAARSVVELKIWRGSAYNERGREQLFGYLDHFSLDKGYLLSFNFNKGKKPMLHEITYNGKRILEVVV